MEPRFLFGCVMFTSPCGNYLQMLLKHIFGRWFRRNSREFYSCVRMSDLTDELYGPKDSSTTENEKNIKIIKSRMDLASVNTHLDQKKTVKVKITMLKKDNVQLSNPIETRPNDRSTSTSQSEGYISGEDMCITDESDDDSSTLALKTPDGADITIDTISPDNINTYCNIPGNEEITDFIASLNKNDNLQNEEPVIYTKAALNTSIMKTSTTDDSLVEHISNTHFNWNPRCEMEEQAKKFNLFTPFEIMKTIHFLKKERELYNKEHTKTSNITSCINKHDKSSLIHLTNYDFGKKFQCDVSPIQDVTENLIDEGKRFTPNMSERALRRMHNSIDFDYDMAKRFLTNDSSSGFSEMFIGSKKQTITTNDKVLVNPPKISRNNTPTRESPNQHESSFNLNGSNESQIIHDIIMEHFADVLHALSKKRTKRKHRRNTSLIDEQEDLTKESHQPGCEREQEQRNVKVLDSGVPDVNRSMKVSQTYKDKEILEYDADSFLRGTLGEESMNISRMSQTNGDTHFTSTPFAAEYSCSDGTRENIRSSEISTLVSTTNNKCDIESLYSVVKKPKKKKPEEPKKNTVVRPLCKDVSFPSYESLDKFRMNPKSDELNKEISVLQGIIRQTSNVIDMCESGPKLYGSVGHIEAERIRLHSTYKLGVLHEELFKCEFGKREHCSGIIKIKSLKYRTRMDTNAQRNKQRSQYYLCLLHSGTTVFASGVSSEQKNGYIIFDDSFEFNFHTFLSEVQIKITIYLLNIRNIQNNRILCLFPNKTYSLRKTLKENLNNNSTYPTIPHIQLLGSSIIGLTELSTESEFEVNNISDHVTLSDRFNAKVSVSLNLNNKFRGFLNISVGSILYFTKMWCSLKGFNLQFWNYPSQEDDMAPNAVINLENCRTSCVSNTDSSICPRERSFILDVNCKETSMTKTYFLSVDNLSEFEEWKEQINIALTTLKHLKNLKCESVLLKN